MPATSVKQRRYFGMVESGKIPKPPGISDKAVKEFASTKESGLPKRKYYGDKKPQATQ